MNVRNWPNWVGKKVGPPDFDFADYEHGNFYGEFYVNCITNSMMCEHLNHEKLLYSTVLYSMLLLSVWHNVNKEYCTCSCQFCLLLGSSFNHSRITIGLLVMSFWT